MNRPLRVAAIILEYHPIVGGAQRQLARLAPLMQKKGVDLRVFTRRYDQLPGQEMINGIPVMRLPAPGPKPLAGPVFIGTTLRAIRSFNPDLVHAFSLFSPLRAAVWAKKLWGTPVAVKILRGGELGDIQRTKKKGDGLHRLALYRRYVDRFITISEEIKNELLDIDVPLERQSFIPNGVDVNDIRPIGFSEKRLLRGTLDLPPGPLVIYTGRFVPAKQLTHLLEVWGQIAPRCPKAHLLLLGDGPEEARLRAMNVERVIFGGRVDDVKPYLQAADIFVLPSATEGLSNALLEGMAAGLPVIATAVGGAPDVIQHGESGWLIDPQDPHDLKAALLSLLSKPALCMLLGKKGRNHVYDWYGLESVADRHLALYRELMGEEKDRADITPDCSKIE